MNNPPVIPAPPPGSVYILDRTPEEVEEARLKGLKLCKFRAQKEANKRRAAVAILDRGPQLHPFPNGRHRYVHKPFAALPAELPEGWRLEMVLEPRANSKKKPPKKGPARTPPKEKTPRKERLARRDAGR